MERIQFNYLKLTLELDRNTQSYIVLEKTKWDEQWLETGKRVIRFEENNRMRENKEILA